MDLQLEAKRALVSGSTAEREILAFVAGGAVLGFEVFHRHFEHVVAADADTMNFRGRLLSRLRFRGVAGVRSLARFRHKRILARTGKAGMIGRLRPTHKYDWHLQKGSMASPLMHLAAGSGVS
jgi:hypothetical protein